MTPEQKKNRIRNQMLSKLRGWTEDHRETLSHSVRVALKACESLESARTILAFAPLSSEPIIDQVLDAWRTEGRRILLPRTLDAPGDMELVELQGLMGELPRGAFGVRTPAGPPCQAERIDAILVPGVAFAHDGGRLGHGGGYYDRLLAEVRHTVRLGVAFECQRLSDLPQEPHDQKVHFVVTEGGIFQASERMPPSPE